MSTEVKMYYKNPDGSDGNLKEHYYLKDGKKDGEFLMYFENNQLQIKTTYKSNYYEGAFVAYYPDGTLNTETFFVNGKQHGTYKDYHPNGSLKIIATYENGFKVLHKDFYLGPSNGIGHPKVVAQCKDGRFHGSYKVYYDILPGEAPSQIIDSVPYGPLKQENNNLNGEGHGVIKKYHRNGKLMTMYLLNHGIPRGISKTYNEAGELIESKNYDDYVNFLSALGVNMRR